MSEPHIQYHTSIVGKLYGVHVTGLTKTEASAMLAGAALVQRERHGGKQTAFEYAEFVGEVETPIDRNPSSTSDKWTIRAFVLLFGAPLVAWLCSDAITNIIHALRHCNGCTPG